MQKPADVQEVTDWPCEIVQKTRTGAHDTKHVTSDGGPHRQHGSTPSVDLQFM